MKIARSALTLTVLLVAAVACDTLDPTEAVAPAVSLSAARPGPSPQGAAGSQSARDQAVMDALANGASSGAVIDREVGCFILLGIGDSEGNLLAFGGLFPGQQDPPCDPGTFARTNPDGSTDIHAKGTGAMFLVVFEPGGTFIPRAVFDSEGSDVDWEWIYREGQGGVTNVRGTLSDGSRLRAHFVNNPNGPVPTAGQLWVEALGWVAKPGK